jgi:hypothetical protein
VASDPPPPPFQLLTPEEFDRLTIQEKAEYLRRAVEAQKAITDHIDRALAAMAKKHDS